MKICINCEDWAKNISSLDSIFVMASIHGASWQGLPFKYCPWCGAELQEAVFPILPTEDSNEL